MAASQTSPALPATLRLWAARARMDAMFVVRSPRIAVTWLVTDLMVAVVGVAVVALVAARFGGIGTWSGYHVLFLLAYSALCGGVVDVLFSFNVSMISRRIGRGQLDHALLQPHPMWRVLLTEGFSPCSSAAGLVSALVLMAWAGPGVDVPVGWMLVNLAASVTVGLSYQFIWGSIAFWAPMGAEEVNSRTGSVIWLRAYPLDAAGRGLRVLLLTALPTGLLAWFPARALLGLSSPWTLWATPAAAGVFAALAALVFRKGLRHYARTGSRRYSDRGHRR